MALKIVKCQNCKRLFYLDVAIDALKVCCICKDNVYKHTSLQYSPKKTITPKPCVYCGKDGVTKDHFIPKSKGGINTVPCCLRCNNEKADMFIEEFLECFKLKNYKFKNHFTEEEKTIIIKNIELLIKNN